METCISLFKRAFQQRNDNIRNGRLPAGNHQPPIQQRARSPSPDLFRIDTFPSLRRAGDTRNTQTTNYQNGSAGRSLEKVVKEKNYRNKAGRNGIPPIDPEPENMGDISFEEDVEEDGPNPNDFYDYVGSENPAEAVRVFNPVKFMRSFPVCSVKRFFQRAQEFYDEFGEQYKFNKPNPDMLGDFFDKECTCATCARKNIVVEENTSLAHETAVDTKDAVGSTSNSSSMEKSGAIPKKANHNFKKGTTGLKKKNNAKKFGKSIGKANNNHKNNTMIFMNSSLTEQEKAITSSIWPTTATISSGDNGDYQLEKNNGKKFGKSIEKGNNNHKNNTRIFMNSSLADQEKAITSSIWHTTATISSGDNGEYQLGNRFEINCTKGHRYSFIRYEKCPECAKLMFA